MRGLFLAVFALLIVAGDSGRYVPQLIANASSVLTPSNQRSDSLQVEGERLASDGDNTLTVNVNIPQNLVPVP